MSSKIRRYETLNGTHTIRAGDTVYVSEYNAWQPVDPNLHGMIYDEGTYAPMRRPFRILGGETFESIDPTKKEKKAYDLKVMPPCNMLIQYNKVMLAVDFDPRRFSPSKKKVYMTFIDKDGNFAGEWIGTQTLESMIIEVLEGHETEEDLDGLKVSVDDIAVKTENSSQ